jgi:hypothetical protein
MSTAISTTIRTSGPEAASLARRLGGRGLVLASRLRAGWDRFALSGQLGPDAEQSIGRSTGCRI